MKSSRRTIARVLAATALAVSPALVIASLAASASVAHAEDVAYVDCGWSPYNEAWACALPGSFHEGRFAAPPDFRHDSDSEVSRQRAWAAAKAEPGARPRGRMGVFFPKPDGGWWFVPGASWSPGDPVFLPQGKAPTGG
jgi:hypothetical protein